MKNSFIALLLLAIALFAFTACSDNGKTSSNSTTNTVSKSDSTVKPEAPANSENADISVPSSDTNTPNSASESGSKVLVAFFSRADENYGVGYIEKGNTHIIADMIAEEMGADSFEIVRVTPYPAEYDACTDEAKKEQNAKARPELTAKVDNFDDYDIVFLGYPNWWGDMPMPVYTFIESYDFSGKTVIPFCTHAGSGLSGTVNTLKSKLVGATVLDGIAIAGTTAQNDRDSARSAVMEWLGKFDI